jgi:hypothetical protein
VAGDGDGDRRRVGERRLPCEPLATSFGEEPVVERDRQPRLLGDPPECLRLEQPTLGVLPPGRRLDGGHPPRRQLDPRSVAGAQFVPGHRPPQVRLKTESLAGGRRRPRLVDRAAVAARLLRPIEGRVGVVQQLRGASVGGRGQGDADARRGHGLVATEFDRVGERGADPVGDGRCLRLVPHPVEQHRELVAPEPRHRVAGPDAVAQAVADGDEEPVPRRVAEGIVDQLEAVQVEEEDGDRLPLAARAGERRREAVGEEVAVRQPGQHVVERPMGKLGLGPLPQAALAFEGPADRRQREQEQRQHPGVAGGEAGDQHGQAHLGGQGEGVVDGRSQETSCRHRGRRIASAEDGDGPGAERSGQAGRHRGRDDGEQRPGAIEDRPCWFPAESPRTSPATSAWRAARTAW